MTQWRKSDLHNYSYSDMKTKYVHVYSDKYKGEYMNSFCMHPLNETPMIMLIFVLQFEKKYVYNGQGIIKLTEFLRQQSEVFFLFITLFIYM